MEALDREWKAAEKGRNYGSFAIMAFVLATSLLVGALQTALASSSPSAVGQAWLAGDPSNPQTAVASKSSSKEQRKLSKQEKRREKAIRKEMESPYLKWMNGPVGYIITPQERAAFKKLTTDDEREQFIQAFWERRNPNPGDPENEAEEEFYRRVAYANEHYASGIPGWRTDRGRIYIMWGPPNEIENHDSGGTYVANPEELPYSGPGASDEMTTYPFEDWTYNYIPGIGENVKLEFVDPTMSGEFRLTMNPCEKDAMAEVPGDMTGCQGPASIGPIFNPNSVINPSQLSGGGGSEGSMVTSNMMPESMDEFTQLDTYSKIFQPPPVKFNDLKDAVTHRIVDNVLPFRVLTDYVRLTAGMDLVPITVQVANKSLEFENKNGVMQATMDIYAQLSTLSGRVATTFEKELVADVPQDDFSSFSTHQQIYQQILPLHPGRYKLTLVLKDDNSGHMGTTSIGIIVPEYPDGELKDSSLILADLIQQVPTTDVGTGQFIIGGTKVRPKLGAVFSRNQQLGIYMQVYNLGLNPQTHRPNANIQYQLLKNGKPVFSSTQNAAEIKNASSQVTIQKLMPLEPLSPGEYTM
ncbi:MAG: GWxTD domain-containing protein, partial [Terriglobia bacterium]